MKRKSINPEQLCNKIQRMSIKPITGSKRKCNIDADISNKIQKLDLTESVKSPIKMIDKECQTDSDYFDFKYNEMLAKEIMKYKKLLDSKYESHLNDIGSIKHFCPSDIY